MEKEVRSQRIGIITGGGVAPGLNAVLYGAAEVLKERQDTLMGIPDGWEGFTQAKKLVDLTAFTRARLTELIGAPGTILGTSRTRINKLDEYLRAAKIAADYRLDGLIAVGGDDTIKQAQELHERRIVQVNFVPKTIDADISGTERTFGFETAYNEVAEAVSKMRVDAKAMHRIAVVEVQGRNSGFIAIYGGATGGADITLIPEFPIPNEHLCNRVRGVFEEQGFAVIVVAEGYRTENADKGTKESIVVDPFGNVRQNGAARAVSAILTKGVPAPTEEQIVGYLPRSSNPLSTDILFATRLGAMAALLTHQKIYGKSVVLKDGRITDMPLESMRGGRKVTELLYDPENLRMHVLPPEIMQGLLYRVDRRESDC